MPLIYTPKGKAREYSPLALNVYTGGCEHQCSYCYCRSIGAWTATPRPRNLDGLRREAPSASRQILLSFMSDPYGPIEATYRNTRRALGVLSEARCSVAILTKGGARCLDDIDILRDWPDGRVKVGATLTFLDRSKSMHFEPGAAVPEERIDALRFLKQCGVSTWASIEPVIDPAESLRVIQRSIPYIDAYKVGKLNHHANSTDWSAFGKAAVAMIREAGRRLYVKDDLRPYLPPGFLTTAECDNETLTLPDREVQCQATLL